MLVMAMSGVTLTPSKQSGGAEYEISKALQQKSALLDVLQSETKRYEVKKLSLEHDLADLELCETIMRLTAPQAGSQLQLILFFLKGKTASKEKEGTA